MVAGDTEAAGRKEGEQVFHESYCVDWEAYRRWRDDPDRVHGEDRATTFPEDENRQQIIEAEALPSGRQAPAERKESK